MTQRKTGVLLVYVKTILSVGISLIYTPFMLQTLGQSEYGSMNLASSVISYLNLIGLGVSSSYIRYNMRCRKNKDKEAEYQMNGAYLLLFSIMGVASLLAGIALVANAPSILGDKILPGEYDTLKKLMILCVINIAFSFPGTLFRMMLNSYEKFTFIHFVELISSVVQPGICFVLLLNGYKSIALQCVAVAGNFLAMSANAFYALRLLHLKFTFKGIKLVYYKEILVFSSFLFLNQIVNTINWNVDSYLTALFIGTAGTAIYAFGYQFMNYYMLLSTAISNVFAPLLNELVLNNDMRSINDTFCRIGRLQFLLLGFVLGVFLIIGKDFIILFTGSEAYIESYYVAVILMTTTLVPLSQNLAIEIQRAKNMHQFRAVLYLGIAAINLGISIPLCKAFGAVGCAAGTGFAQILGNTIIMNIYNYRKVGIDIKSYFVSIGRMIPAFAAALILCYAAHKWIAFPLNKVTLVGEGVLCVCVFFLILWGLAMNPYEKGLIRTFLRGLLKRA